jgi:NAD(P)-dependent dehydrogenase (short-subunit alcohol dehydrogenase family)
MPRRSPAPRVALVTGANRGIGLEISRQLVQHGLRVVMTGRDSGKLEKAARSVRAENDQILTVPMDVADPGSVHQAHRWIGQKAGGVDVIVNNAAVLLQESSGVLEIPIEDYQRTFEANLFGVIEVCRVFVPDMARRSYGRVVNVSSGVAQFSGMSTYAPAYTMSKVTLNAFTKILAETFRGDGILVNAVDPGWVRTDMGGPGATRSVEQGADTIVWLATLPDNGPTGGFFRDRQRIEW